jgi:hypothetical protein
MNGPSDDLRANVFETIELTREESDTRAEAILAETLDRIDAQIVQDLAEGWDDVDNEEAAFQALGVIDAWAGLASAAVAKVYAPASPWPRGFAGWSQAITQRLRELARRLNPVLQAIKQALGAVSWSIGVAFPWGISVSLTWP